jgi:deoxyribonuclease-4
VKIGAHESASGGLHRAVERAIADNCESVQVFVKNNNRWKQRDWREDEIETFRKAYDESGLEGLVAHTSYLINLCSDKDATIEKSIDALEDELDRCAKLGVPYLVMHPGSHVGQGEEEGIKLIAENLEAVYAREKNDAWKDVTLLFENTAGQGTNLGHSLDHLVALFDAVHDPSRFGICFDTCHAHAAGYDLTTEDLYEDFWREFDALIGVDRVKAFHLNDSKKPLGSRKDRHENIGDGEIGKSVFEFLVNDARFADVPATLETPMDKENGYADEIALLKNMRVRSEEESG